MQSAKAIAGNEWRFCMCLLNADGCWNVEDGGPDGHQVEPLSSKSLESDLD